MTSQYETHDQKMDRYTEIVKRIAKYEYKEKAYEFIFDMLKATNITLDEFNYLVIVIYGE